MRTLATTCMNGKDGDIYIYNIHIHIIYVCVCVSTCQCMTLAAATCMTKKKGVTYLHMHLCITLAPTCKNVKEWCYIIMYMHIYIHTRSSAITGIHFDYDTKGVKKLLACSMNDAEKNVPWPRCC